MLNRIISSVRIKVEHAIAGVKRCRIVKDILRLTKTGIADLVMENACALHNLRVDMRYPKSAPALVMCNPMRSICFR
jgi:hypothetical protein